MNATRPCNPRPARLTRRADPQPHPAAAGWAGTERLGVVHRAAAAAVDGQSASEGARRCRLGVVASRRHEQRLRHVPRGARCIVAPAVDRWCANRSGPSAAALQDQRRLQAAMSARRSKSVEFFTSSAGQWDRVRDEMFGDRFHLAALAGIGRSRRNGRRPRLRHRPGQRRDRTVRRARHRRGQLGRDAPGRAQATSESPQRRTATRRTRGAADRRQPCSTCDGDAGAAPCPRTGPRPRGGRARR